MAEVSNHRRYLFLKYRAAVAAEEDMESVWDAKRRTLPGTELPVGFPSRAKLLAAGYLVAEELAGADEQELEGIGLTTKESTAVIAAIEALL